MSPYLLIILLLLGLLIWALYSFFSPAIKVFRQVYKMGRGVGPNDTDRRRERDRRETTTRHETEEQSTVDLIHETNMDLEGGEYVDYEEIK